MVEDEAHEEPAGTVVRGVPLPGSSDTAKRTTFSQELSGLSSNLGPAWDMSSEGQRSRHARRLYDTASLAMDDEDLIPIFAAACLSSPFDDGIVELSSYKAALESPEADQWEAATQQELRAVLDHKVFGNGDLVPLPVGWKALPSHWVYKVKRDKNEKIQRFKSRLVCGGNHQTAGIDFKETYAPTARLGHV